jgi:hypothetical protein
VTVGKVVVLGILIPAALAGGAMWYLQVYGYYYEVPFEQAVRHMVVLADGSSVLLPVVAAEAIDADSSPIRYRACLSLSSNAPRPEEVMPYPDAQVLRTPGWFGCFDAAEIDAAMADGTAVVALSEADRPWGVDRVVAIRGEQAWVWPQINRCGLAVFSGEPLPEGCTPPPEG